MRYKALPKESEVNPEVALLQGALALDAAAEMAEKLNDVEGMLNVAAMWMKFSEGLHGFIEKAQEAEEKAELKDKEGEMVKTIASKIEVGFQGSKPEADPITVEEEDEVDG